MHSQDIIHKNISLDSVNPKRIAAFVGELNGNLKLIEKTFSVRIFHKDDKLEIKGDKKNISHASDAILDLYSMTKEVSQISKESLHLCIQSHLNISQNKSNKVKEKAAIKTPKKIIQARSSNQSEYIQKINKFEVNFGIGPAGTGKTYIAVAAAVNALVNERVKRIVLIRPAVEAGEKLGFLPGDLSQKVDPYLRPLYDALFDMLGADKTNRLVEKDIIEVAPLAFLRGRTLNNSFIIMDEGQNTTVDQMKMVLTRMGYGSVAIINGDLSQIDLPKQIESGLSNILKVTKNIKNIGVTKLTSADVIRHPLVREIIDAYDKYNSD